MIYLMSAINRRMAIDTTERQQLIKLQNYLQSAVHSAFLVPSNGTWACVPVLREQYSPLRIQTDHVAC